MRDEKLLSKIAALLRQAEGTDNEHEAHVFMHAAQRLATAASVDIAVARAHDPRARMATVPVSRQIRIGEPGKRGLRTYVLLFVAIAHANDVKVDVAGNSTYVIAYGFPGDIESVEALYSSLVVQMVAASDAYVKSGRYKSETARHVVTGRGARSRRRVVQTKPLSGITARLNFQTAFADRIGQRLEAARDEVRRDAEADRDSPDGVVSTVIALRDKEIEVLDFHRSESTARGTWRSSSRSAGYSDAARREGDQAARRARLGESAGIAARRALPKQ